MARIDINGAGVGNALQDLLMADDLEAGDPVSYQLCKTIYSFHPLGRKMVEAPVAMAQSQEREITVPAGPDDVRDAFKREWKELGADKLIAQTRVVSRIYGIASIAMLVDGQEPTKPVNFKTLFNSSIAFNVLDPLNTAGSLVLNQNPNAMDFMKFSSITIAGAPYHRSRTCTIMNEEPLFIEYTNSAFGFVGRSVYQRALYPLKSFINTMITDDMIARKAGVLIAKIKQPGSVIDNMMATIAGFKRAILQEAETNNVISISSQDNEEIESLNLQNLDGAAGMARTNILKNIATAADMPAVMLENETLTEGFGEGTEDAKTIARYIDRERVLMNPLYGFFDKLCKYRAWNPEFFKIMQTKYPETYGSMEYNQAFYEWENSFAALWPNLLEEPDSEKIKTQDVVFKAAIAAVEVMLPAVDPENRVILLEFLADTLNANKMLFPEPLELDYDALAKYDPQEAMQNMQQGGEGEEPGPGSKTFEKADSFARIESRPGMRRYDEAVNRILRLPLKKAANE